MDNRLAVYTQGVVLALFEDCKYLYAKVREWDRDRSRLLSQMGTRGIALLCLEFPALSKHLRRCLDEGTFTNPHLVLSRPKRNGEEIPKLFREIYLRIFTPQGELLATPCVDSILTLETFYGTFKSIRIVCPKEAVDAEVKNFFHLDATLPRPSLDWDLDELGVDESEDSHRLARSLHVRDFEPNRATLPFEEYFPVLSGEECDTLQRCFDIVASEYGLAPHLRGGRDHIHSKPRHGPGAVAEMSKRNSKYRFLNWPAKLQHLFPRDEYALPSFGRGFSCVGEADPGLGLDYESEDTWLNHEPSSRLIAVPKTIDKPRLIAAEPAAHQWIQQLLLQEFERLTRQTSLRGCLDFRSQVPNQELALKGSIHGDYVTMDLSEASDRLTCRLVERFWRSNPGWLEALHACRTRSVSYTSDKFSETTRLNKFACMGSAVTFPLQSIVYATFGLAALCITRSLIPTQRRLRGLSPMVRVFGDDIIIERGSFGVLQRIFAHCGFKVNSSKTFSGKNFRESCGVSAFRGYNVTPPRVREVPNGALSQVPSLVETSNNFHRSGFWNTARYILDQTQKYHHMIPISRQPDFPVTILSFCGSELHHLKRRWNHDLQREEVRVLKTHTVSQQGEMTARERIMQYFTEDPDPESNWKSGFSRKRTVTNRPGWVVTTS